MERYEEIQQEYTELYHQLHEIQGKMNALSAEWKTEGLASVGLKVGDIVLMGNHKFSVSGMTNTPYMGPYSYRSTNVDGYKIKKDGTPSVRVQYIGNVTAKDKVEA